MIKIICSFRKIDGPRVDGGWVIQFDVPEVLYDQIKELPNLRGKNIVLEIKEYINDNGNLERDPQENDDESDGVDDSFIND